MPVSTNKLAGVSVPGNPAGDTAQPDNRLFTPDVPYPPTGLSVVFHVTEAYAVIQAYNLAAGAFHLMFHDHSTGMVSPVYRDGVRLQLTPTNTQLILDTPGQFRLQAVGVTGNAAVVTFHESALPPIQRATGGGSSGATGATGATGAAGATGETGAAGTSAALEARVPSAFTFTNGNATVVFDTPRNLANSPSRFTWNNSHFTPTDGLFKVEAGLRITGMTGGTYARLRLMSGLNTIDEDLFTWTAECDVSAVTMLVSAFTNSAALTNKILHVLYDTDATLTAALFHPSGCRFMAFRVADAVSFDPGPPVGM